jgi:hypothetical protein
MQQASSPSWPNASIGRASSSRLRLPPAAALSNVRPQAGSITREIVMWQRIIWLFQHSFRFTPASACVALVLICSQPTFAQVNTQGCVPVEQRAGREVGCYIMVIEKLGRL